MGLARDGVGLELKAEESCLSVHSRGVELSNRAVGQCGGSSVWQSVIDRQEDPSKPNLGNDGKSTARSGRKSCKSDVTTSDKTSYRYQYKSFIYSALREITDWASARDLDGILIDCPQNWV